MLNAFITPIITYGNWVTVLSCMLLKLIEYSILANLMESDILYHFQFAYRVKSSRALTPGKLIKVLAKDTSESNHV